MPDPKMNRCRLCGAEPILVDLYYGWYFVHCSDSTCSNSLDNTISSSVERAVNRWNKRNPEEDHV